METIFHLPPSAQEEIQAQAKPFTYGRVDKVRDILTDQPSLPGHSDQGHHTEIIRISSREIGEASDTMINLAAIVCLSCLPKELAFALFATSRKVIR